MVGRLDTAVRYRCFGSFELTRRNANAIDIYCKNVDALSLEFTIKKCSTHAAAARFEVGILTSPSFTITKIAFTIKSSQKVSPQSLHQLNILYSTHHNHKEFHHSQIASCVPSLLSSFWTWHSASSEVTCEEHAGALPDRYYWRSKRQWSEPIHHVASFQICHTT